MVCVAGSCRGAKPARLAVHSVRTLAEMVDSEGRPGTDVSTLLKLKALVKSPTAARRQAERLGTSAPNRVSRKRRTEVWSKRSDETNPPRLKGETMVMGTRKPRPMGPVMAGLPSTVASGTGGAVRYSPGVPGGAVVGGT